jgi:hypothetical protein
MNPNEKAARPCKRARARARAAILATARSPVTSNRPTLESVTGENGSVAFDLGIERELDVTAFSTSMVTALQ